MIIIPYYSRVIYILFDYKIINFKLDETIFHKNGIVCILCSWYKSDKLSKIVKENSEYNIVILANSLEEKKFFESRIPFTLKSFFISFFITDHESSGDLSLIRIIS